MSARRPDRPEEWIRRARSDMAIARAALTMEGVVMEDVCFHAQQCAEKALKGLLVARHLRLPRTHVLEYLMDLLASDGLAIPDEVTEAMRLTDYAMETRYPGLWEPITPEDAVHSIDLAQRVLDWVVGLLPHDARYPY